MAMKQNLCGICRERISDGRTRCLACIDIVPTHVAIFYEETSTYFLFRASDGMALVHQNGVICVIGEDKNRNVSRCFMDAQRAKDWTFEVATTLDLAGKDIKPLEGAAYWKQLEEAKAILNGQVPVVEVRDGGKGLYLPSSVGELPTQFKKFN